MVSNPLVNFLYHSKSLLFDVKPIDMNDGYAPIAARSLKATATDLYAIFSGWLSSGK